MMTQNPDAAQTWRDLQDQLTPAQIQDLERWEQTTPGDRREYLLGDARDYIAGNERDAELSARILPPAGATAGDWDSIEITTRRPCRCVEWARHVVAGFSVVIDGWQDETGTVDGPRLLIYGLEEGGELSAAEARQLSLVLVEAAAALEALL